MNINEPMRLSYIISTCLFLILLPQLGKAQASEKQSLLWQIESPSATKPSYLYGTMHSKTKKVFEFNQVVLDKFNETVGFAAELKLDSASLKYAAKTLLMGGDTTLSKLLSKKDYKLVETAVKRELGTDLIAFNKLRPIQVMTLIQQKELIHGEVSKFLDQYFHDKAEKEGKKVYGVETVDEQVRAFGSVDLKKQCQMLVEAIKKFEENKAKQEEENKKLLALYLAADLKGMLQTFSNAEMPAEMKENLLDKRNVVMARRIDSLIKLNTMFVAVGAAHLPGEKGVIELLRKKGYKVTAIPFTFDGTGYAKLVAGDPSFLANSKKEDNTKPKTDTGGWVEYESKEGKFKIWFPSKPNERQDKAVNEKGDSVVANSVMNVDMMTGKTYVASYVDSDQDLSNSKNAKKAMKKRLDEQLAKNNGKVVKQDDITYKNMKGMETTIEVMGMMKLTMRTFASGKRVYTIMAGGMINENMEAQKQKFFNSFELLK